MSLETKFIKEDQGDFLDFESSFDQSAFTDWCKANDSIVPEYISREVWNEKVHSGLLELRDDGKKSLFIPEDLKVWEITDLIKVIELDTYQDNEEVQNKGLNKINELGKTFENAGLYLQEYLPIIEEGKVIAEDISREFYNYGKSLCEGTENTDELPRDRILKEDDKKKIDAWLLGNKAYQKRINRLGDNPTSEKIEETRKDLIKSYFKILAKDFDNEENILYPKFGSSRYLQARTRAKISNAIQLPQKELYGAIFRRGIEFLKNGMGFSYMSDTLKELEEKVKNGEDSSIDRHNIESIKSLKEIFEKWKNFNYQTYYEGLEIPKLKKELEEIKNSNDQNRIAEKELEITDSIQQLITKIPYKDASNNPADMLNDSYANCLGTSILAGAFLDEIGIKYLHAYVPRHSLAFVITSTNQVYWRDFTNGQGRYNDEVKDENLKIGSIKEIIDFLDQNEESNLRLELEKNYQDYIEDKESGEKYVNLSNGQIGLETALLSNLAVNSESESKIVFRFVIGMINPNNVNQTIQSILIMKSRSKKEGNYDSLKKVIYEMLEGSMTVNVENKDLLELYGDFLIEDGNEDQALEVYKKAISCGLIGFYKNKRIRRSLTIPTIKELFEYAIQFYPEDYSLQKNYGIFLYNEVNKEEGIGQFKKAISLDPNNLGIRKDLELKLEDEENLYKFWLEKEPEENIMRYIYYKLARNLRSQDKYQEAISYLNRSLKLKEDARSYNELARNIEKIEPSNYDEAIRMYNKAIEIKNDDSDSYYRLGIVYRRKGNQEIAIKMLNKAIELDPTIDFYYEELGDIFTEIGDYEEAIEMYKKNIEIIYCDFFLYVDHRQYNIKDYFRDYQYPAYKKLASVYDLQNEYKLAEDCWEMIIKGGVKLDYEDQLSLDILRAKILSKQGKVNDLDWLLTLKRVYDEDKSNNEKGTTNVLMS